jgi:hypothetical protein
MIFNNASVFLGTADNAVQAHALRDDDRLHFEIVVMTLLGHRVLIGTPYIWQSETTLKVVSRLRSLFEDAEPGPRLTGRTDIITSGEYFRHRESDTSNLNNIRLRSDSPFAGERPDSSSLDWRSLIGPDTHVLPRTGSVENIFRALVANDSQDLYEGYSLLGLARKSLGAPFSGIGRATADDQMLRLVERSLKGHFSRAAVEDHILSSPIHIDVLPDIAVRTTGLFQIANGFAHNSAVFTEYNTALRSPRLSGIPIIHRWSINPINPYLFCEVLRGIGIQQNAWLKLSTLDIIKIVATKNPLYFFGQLYVILLSYKIIEWSIRGVRPSFEEAARDIRSLLLGEEGWRVLEFLSRWPDRKFDSLYAGVAAGGIGSIFGGDPLKIGGAIRTTVDLGQRLIEGLEFFNRLRLRALLRQYCEGVGLLEPGSN